MPLKVLLLNFSRAEISRVPSNVVITQSTIEQKPTLYDFHAILMDTSEILKDRWWPHDDFGRTITHSYHSLIELTQFQKKVKEQLETGGITFCFSSSKSTQRISINARGLDKIDNYFFCPIDLGVVSESGDTFNPRFEELKYFTPLVKHMSLKDIEWSCYFSKVPKNARVLGVNRAGYSVFIEVPLGTGKLVMLPRFKDRIKAATIIVNEIIPQMIREEEVTFVPKWLTSFSSPFENQIRIALKEIEKAKRLLFTKDKVLEKAVAFALEKLGFEVNILPDGTLPDLRIADEEQRAIVEVKGHENRQATRRDVLQLLGYMSETDIEEKGIVISNHEFSKEPSKRSNQAFTDGAVKLGKSNDISLISSASLYKVVIKVLEEKLDSETVKKMRDKIMSSSGLVQLS